MRILVALVLFAGCVVPDAETDLVDWRIEVLDSIERAPIAGAIVRVGGLEATATTSRAGIAHIAVPAGTYGLVVGGDGYREVARNETAGDKTSTFLLADETPSEGAIDSFFEERSTARLLRDDPDDPALRPEVRAFLRGEIGEAELTRNFVVNGDIAGTRLALDAPPATVRIWRRSIDGASESCAGRIDVFPLEDYVKGVLPHEWIRSWHDQSLTAGSLAIRTYVWNWVLRGGKYDCADLDDTTRSQVYRDDRDARASAAVDTTAGQGITRGTTLVSGEYSAENATPTADGISDPLCAGHALFGHGRGMCQWGTQRWALDGRDYLWMAEHYFPGSIVEGGTPPGPAYDASFVAVDHPETMVSGERAMVWVELSNTGRATWDLAATRLATTNPRDHESAFFDAENWIAPNRATAPDHSTYTPGSTGRFTFMITAPEVAEETVVTETFGLVQELVAWFGPEDVTISIRVTPRVTETPDPGPDPMPDPTDPSTPDPMDPPGMPGDPSLEGEASASLSGSCSAGGDAHVAPLLLAFSVACGLRRRRR
jgi:hypothetical protein